MSRIRVKTGNLEIECEGPDDALEKQLSLAVSALTELQSSALAKNLALPFREESPGSTVGTTATIASALGCKSGSDLVIAAAAQLTLVQGRHQFSRKDLLAEMRGATGFFSEGIGNNLSSYLQTTMKAGNLLEHSSGNYVLSAA